MEQLNLSPELDSLFSPETIRSQSRRIFERAKEGETHFSFHPEKWDVVVDKVEETILKNYPDLDIPEHGRAVHLNAGGIDRINSFFQGLGALRDKEKAMALFDLVLTSVLLDAGAGKDWTYKEEGGSTYSRSEGLGVASFHTFISGAFSDTGSSEATAKGLQEFSEDELRNHFQVTEKNPLLGVQGRVALLQNLGKTIEANPELFPNGRASGILMSMEKNFGQNIEATQILKAILVGFGDIWPGRLTFQGKNLGDVWHYPAFGGDSDPQALVPFHKLSQWLSYSLFPAFRTYGFNIQNQEKLTGLPEYRNGGLFIDTGLIALRDENKALEEHPANSPLIVEWRALTITLLDELAPKIRERMKKPTLPMANILEGGTWWAGRYLANELRPSGEPPLKLKSDGTVF